MTPAEHPRGMRERPSPELLARFSELAELVPAATRRPMFGFPSLVIDGHLFLSAFGDALALRLGDEDRRLLIERHGAEPFEPAPGRPMTGFVLVPREHCLTDELDPWVPVAFEFARGLPPKPPRRPRQPRL